MASKTSDLVFRFVGKDDTGPATRSAASNLDDLGRSADGLSGTFKGLGVAAGAAAALAGVKIGSFAKDSLMSASDLNETMSKTSVVFGDAAGWVQEWSKGTATALGQTRTQALDAAATFGGLGKSAGLTGNALGSFSTDMTVLASDMASFSNTSVDQAIEAIGAAMRGESEPIRAYNVLLDDASLKAKAMELGIYDGSGALTQQQRVLAAQKLILEQTTDAQNDFQRTQGGTANQLRTLSAQWGHLKEVSGEALLPLATSLLPQVNAAVESGTAKLVQYMPEIKAGAESAGRFVGDLLGEFSAHGPDGERSLAALKAGAVELGDMARSAAAKAGELTKWYTDLSPEAQNATLAIGGTVAALTLLNRTAKANPVMKIGVELTGTVLQATAKGSIDLLFRSLANRIAAMTVTAGVVNVNGAAGVPDAPGVDGPGGKPGGKFTGLFGLTASLAALGVGAFGAQKVSEWSMGGVQRSTSPANVSASAYDSMTEQEKATAQAAADAAARTREIGEAARGNLAPLIQQATEAGQVVPAADASVTALGRLGASAGLSADESARLGKALATMDPGTTVGALSEKLGYAGQAAGLTAAQIGAIVPQLFGASGAAAATAQRIAGIQPSADLSKEALARVAGAVNQLPVGANADLIRAAITGAGQAAGLSQAQIDQLAASVVAVPGQAQVPALAASIASAGQAAGLSQSQIDLMTIAASAIPPGASAGQLREAIASAGTAAGLSQGQIDALTLAAWAVPGSANVPALQKALGDAGGAAGLSKGQMDALALAVGGIPEGTNVADAGNRIWEAGVKAGVSSGDMDVLTGKILGIPGWHHTAITSTAKAEGGEVETFQQAIDRLRGKTVKIDLQVGTGVSGTVNIGSGAGGGRGVAGSGIESTMQGMVDSAALDEGNRFLDLLKSNVDLLAKYTGALGGSAEALARAMEGAMGATTLNGHVTSNMCLANVSDLAAASGFAVTRHPYALHQAQAIMAAGRMNPGLPPRGGLAWWSSLGDGFGHVAVGLGGGYVGNTWGAPWITKDYVPNMSPGAYLGWSDPSTLALASGGLVPARVSAGEAYIPPSKVKGNLALLHAVNAGAIRGGARRHHEGLSVFSGPGTGTSDSIRALLPRGAYVVNARASRESAAILAGVMRGGPAFASGGLVGGGAAGAAAVGVSATAVEVHIDGRALHESLLRWRRTSGGAPLGLG